MKDYAVCGRIPDEEDECAIFQAESECQAIAMFVDKHLYACDEDGSERANAVRQYSEAYYINHVITTNDEGRLVIL